ncbi:MAG TPA: NapC/NirT family cytochrome c [Nitrospirota bacterium]|nr:NapC/NirT family cytochrome c [Nitrospirota bacterium]
MKRILPLSFYNPLTLAGSVIALFNLALIVFLLIFDLLSKRPRPYSDLVILLILPVFILIGVAFVVLGIVRQRRRQRIGVPLEEQRLLVLDFNDHKQRRLVILLSAGFVFLTLLYTFGMFQGYEFVESTSFCSQTCHAVMGPQSRAHAFSHHAEVECSACHVGSGTQYFVLSKFKGTAELYELLSNKFPRPIPAPVKDLRPSKDICQGCHGPTYAFEENLRGRKYYLSDTKNTEWTIGLLLKMGAVRVQTDKPPMMHWHYAVARQIEYATADPKREAIPWVRAIGFDGKARIYRAEDGNTAVKEPAPEQKRVMDCIDCHNRVGHEFYPPDKVVNALLSLKLIDPSLPDIKSTAVQALEGKYASREAARSGIKDAIMESYKKKYPDIVALREVELKQVIARLQDLYDRICDPFMKVSWKNYPNQSGHMYSLGCFRCHDGKHKSDDGTVLSKDCSLCHLLIKRQMAGKKTLAVLTEETYPHPVDIGDSYRTMNCSDCHGVSSP